MNPVHGSSKTPEHYTPPAILEAVVAVLGAIDLDPASNPGRTVPAARHYTVVDDGLAQPWCGRVFLNPPYGRGIEPWIKKLVTEHTSGRVEKAIALLPARVDTQWFRRLRDYPCCFVKGRLTFIGNENAAPFPSVVVYLGTDHETFTRTFAAIGDIWGRVDLVHSVGSKRFLDAGGSPVARGRASCRQGGVVPRGALGV